MTFSPGSPPRRSKTATARRWNCRASLLNAARPGAEAERAELAKVLAAKATDAAVPQPARVWVVRQLEYIGAAESVPALTTLLEWPGCGAEGMRPARAGEESRPGSHRELCGRPSSKAEKRLGTSG